MGRNILSRATFTVGAALFFAACSTRAYIADADHEVGDILRTKETATLGGREKEVLYPESRTSSPQTETEKLSDSRPTTRPEGLEVLFIDLRKALSTAVRSNRDYLSRRESLYQQGLSYSLTKFNFGPIFSSTLSYLWQTGKGSDGSQGVNANVNGRQILPTGGTLAISTSFAEMFNDSGPDQTFSASAGVTLTQPLLRGAGYEVSHEALTQAERSIVYAIRDFELFREDFSISIARSFFELVSQKQQLENAEERYRDAAFDRDKAEALRGVDRNTDQEVFRARRSEIENQDALIDARASYDRAVDNFKIQLGLATTAEIELATLEPPFEPIRLDVDSAISCARHNRLDILTERQRLEDAERSVRIAEDDLLPQLDLTVNYGLAEGGRTFANVVPDDFSASAGLSLEIPLQRKAQRNAYRSTLISFEQAKRAYSLRLDQLDLEIRDQLRRLESIEQRILLQTEQIEQEKRAVAVTRIRYEAGDLDNRDLLEARQSLTDAQNTLIRLKVDHFIGRLSLLRDLGVLFIDDEGMWK